VREVLCKIYLSSKLEEKDLKILDTYMYGALAYNDPGYNLDEEQALLKQEIVNQSGGDQSLYSNEEKATLKAAAYENEMKIRELNNHKRKQNVRIVFLDKVKKLLHDKDSFKNSEINQKRH
jgi:hypothetical protein